MTADYDTLLDEPEEPDGLCEIHGCVCPCEPCEDEAADRAYDNRQGKEWTT